MWSPTHVQVTVQRAKGLLTKGKNKSNDCFVTIALGKEKYQTSVKEKASENVEWHEECELQIPQQGNTAEIVLTVLHRNFLGVDEFLGLVSIPLSSFDVYERPKNRWYPLGSKPGKENTKKRGELEIKIGFTVKAGSLTDLTIRKERQHKSSLGQLSSAAQSIGGSLLSIGSLEKRKGLRKLARSIGNRVKGKSKSGLDEREESQICPSRQEPGEADPGVISEDEDEFTFDDLSHKSSASSLNTSAAVVAAQTPSPVLANAAPSKPPRITTTPAAASLPKTEHRNEDEWGQKLYGIQTGASANVASKRREDNDRSKLRNLIDEATTDNREEPPAPVIAPSAPVAGSRDISEPSVAAPRETLREDRSAGRSPRDEKPSRKERRKDREQRTVKDTCDDKGHLSTERIIIGGEETIGTASGCKGRLPHEVLARFEGKSREDLIELTLQLQAEVTDKKKRLGDLEDYIDALLLRVIECSPRLLQNPYTSQRRLSSPGHQ